MFAASFCWAWSLAGESLWLDELHTSWVVADEWSQIAARAQAGNQSPAYFYLVKLTVKLLGQLPIAASQETALRLPSMISWSLTFGIFLWMVNRFASVVYWQRSRQKWGRNCERKGNYGDLSQPTAPMTASGLPPAFRISWGSLALAAGCCTWLFIDRMQSFYASEARVYGILQLLGLVGWLSVAHITFGQEQACGLGQVDWRGQDWRGQGQDWRGQSNWQGHSDWRGQKVSWIAWCLLAPAMLHLHITTVLVVACQWLTLGIFSLRTALGRKIFLLASVWLGCNLWLALRPMGNVWERRSQWLAFAGDASATSLLSQFPALTALIPIVLLMIILRLLSPRRGTQLDPGVPTGGHSGTEVSHAGGHSLAPEPPEKRLEPQGLPSEMPSGTHALTAQNSTFQLTNAASRSIWFWTFASLGPFAMAWALTRLGGVPIFHYRFLIGSAVPIYILLALVICGVRGSSARWLCLAWVFLWLTVSQGSARQWYSGLIGPSASCVNFPPAGWIMGNLRGEGWREACAYVAERVVADSDVVWCSPGLIEARHLVPPLTEQQNEYLSFPLRGIYPISPPLSPDRLAGLVGSSIYWNEQLHAGQQASNIREDSTGTTKVEAAWIIHRGRSASLLSRLEQSRLLEPMEWSEIVEFGAVSVAYGQFAQDSLPSVETLP